MCIMMPRYGMHTIVTRHGYSKSTGVIHRSKASDKIQDDMLPILKYLDIIACGMIWIFENHLFQGLRNLQGKFFFPRIDSLLHIIHMLVSKLILHMPQHYTDHHHLALILLIWGRLNVSTQKTSLLWRISTVWMIVFLTGSMNHSSCV